MMMLIFIKRNAVIHAQHISLAKLRLKPTRLCDTGLRFRLRKTVAVVQLVSVLVDRLRVQPKQEQLNRVTKDETSSATE
jgi:hypothetical protein